MAHIKEINFNSTQDVKEGCTCDRCGQWIKNIWTVEFAEGYSIHFGIDCWEKVYKSGKLSKFGEKEMKKIMKKIRFHQEQLQQYLTGQLTAENDMNYLMDQEDKLRFWYKKPFEEYKAWMINECIPARIERAQQELKRFNRVDFAL